MEKSITTKYASIILSCTLLFSSCASTTMIQSRESGAKIYIDGEAVGQTPYSYSDTKIVGSTTEIRLEKEGYETFNTNLSRDERVDVGAIIGGFFVLVPFLWTMKYKPTHTYELTPIVDKNKQIVLNDKKQNNRSKRDRLSELKQLLDDKIITQTEYEKSRSKILEE